MNVAGIILLRLIKDVNDVGFDDLTRRAFQDAGFPEIDAYFPSPGERASQHARRSRVALVYSLAIAAVSIALTVTGMAAAVWHMGHCYGTGSIESSDCVRWIKGRLREMAAKHFSLLVEKLRVSGGRTMRTPERRSVDRADGSAFSKTTKTASGTFIETEITFRAGNMRNHRILYSGVRPTV